MDRLRRVFKNSFSSASKQNASANAKSTAKKNLKHTKSMPIRRSLEYEYPPDPPPPPRNILHSTKAYSSRFRTHNKPAPSRQVPRNVNAELQEEEDYGNDLEAFPMPPNTLLFPANPSKILAFHDQRNEEQRTAAETRKRRRAGYNLTMHGNASTPTVYHHGSMRQKHVHPSTANTNTGSHRGRSRFDKPLPPSPGDRLEYTSPASTSSSHSNDQNSSSRHRQGSTTPHRSRSRAAPSSHHRVLEERSQYMTEQGMTTYPGIKNVAAVRQGHPVFQVGESDHRQSHRVEILFAPGDEPVPVHSVSQITRQVDDYLVSQNLARNYGEAF
ncbi:hypothetical protein IW261DRAFT_1489425 [Armillaria novae-zelandiae]|uniref:Uncharacterized protein n=1 Tax=Armillaria novae-zelandiae TaxID=153914 RepID=A0AA39U3B3_9AGAR|nr:hypothetical protein IW261DRAFT_1489425 [Armillaria novae-zelandiae]